MSDKETVVITGGGGFIGAQVSKTFADAGYDVIVIDSGARKWATKNYTVFPHDFSSSSTAGILEMFKPNTVVHLAASHVVPDSVNDPVNTTRTMYLCTIHCLICVKAGVKT